jgi:hypothetical protein
VSIREISDKVWTGFRRLPVWVQVVGWLFFWWLLPLPLAWRSRLRMPAKAFVTVGVLLVFTSFVVSAATSSNQPAASAAPAPSDQSPVATPTPTPSPSSWSGVTPRVTRMSLAKARTRLADVAAHVTISITYRYSGKSAGTVLHQSPAAGAAVLQGALVHLIVAKPFPRLPSVVGKKQKDAQHVLKKAGYKVVVHQQVSSRPVGTVISESPSGGQRAKPGSTVTIVVAKAAPSPPPSGGGSGGGGSNCTPGYSPCLLLGPSDYDCYGGTGNGPAYTAPGVTYRVTGSDPYGLDSDNDGWGCE